MPRRSRLPATLQASLGGEIPVCQPRSPLGPQRVWLGLHVRDWALQAVTLDGTLFPFWMSKLSVLPTIALEEQIVSMASLMLPFETRTLCRLEDWASPTLRF